MMHGLRSRNQPRNRAHGAAPTGASCALAIAAMVLAGCGPSSGSIPPRLADNPDVLITIDAEHHTCSVALHTEVQGSILPCNEVAPFVKEQLRLPSGAIYDTQAASATDQASLVRIGDDMKAAGYRFIGGHQEH